MECYSDMKGMKAFVQQLEPKVIMLSEMTQTPEDRQCISSYVGDKTLALDFLDSPREVLPTLEVRQGEGTGGGEPGLVGKNEEIFFFYKKEPTGLEK